MLEVQPQADVMSYLRPSRVGDISSHFEMHVGQIMFFQKIGLALVNATLDQSSTQIYIYSIRSRRIIQHWNNVILPSQTVCPACQVRLEIPGPNTADSFHPDKVGLVF